jgi:hypothetical protein
VRLAGFAEVQEERERFLSMAREWMAVAMHERPTKARPQPDTTSVVALAMACSVPLLVVGSG